MNAFYHDSEIKFDNGETLVIRDFFLANYSVFCSFASKYIPEKIYCEDIVQDVFVSFGEKKRSFANVYSLKSFFYTSVRNSCLDYLKHQKVKEQYQKKIIDKEQLNESFLDEVIRNEAYSIIYQEIDKLPPMGKKVLLLSLNGNSNEEIAEALGIAINTVKTHKARAYQVLRKKLIDIILVTILLGGKKSIML
ncbi:MAG: RNA polymerase sigma-70 factor [Mangrovibacterium sp.]